MIDFKNNLQIQLASSLVSEDQSGYKFNLNRKSIFDKPLSV